jgi:hypothetical protein
MATRNTAAVHSVYFYDTEEALIQRLVGIVNSALNSGNAALMVVTPDHAEQLMQFLSSRLFRTLQDTTRLTIVDADATLQRFMMDGSPDPERFFAAIKGLIDEASIPAEQVGGKLTVFGEMVAVLWGRGEKQAALALEQLWNETLQENRFFLHCAYPRTQFLFDKDPSGLMSICEQHTHTFGDLDVAM